MRRLSGAAVLLWAVVSVGGCAAISGLDQITEQACAPNCEAGTADVVVDSPVDQGSDQWALPDTLGGEAGDDATTEGSDDGPAETSPPIDASHDGDAKAADSPSDSPKDSPVEAPADSGCGTTNTVQNCGACGQSCAAASGSQSGAGCTGTTCLYQCTASHLDCNASVGYDPDGCECATPNSTTATCCGTACPIQHTDGLVGGTYPPNPTFYDCLPSGSMSSTLATDACANFTGNAGLCGTPGECTNSMDAGTGDFVVCGQVNAGSICPCWEYQGPNVSKVSVGIGAYATQCICPGSGSTFANTYSFN